MKKFIFSIGIILASGLYAVFANQNSSAVAILPPSVAGTSDTTSASTPVGANANPSSGSGSGSSSGASAAIAAATKPAPATTQTPAPVSTPAPAPAPKPAPAPTGQYKDGTYTGSAADAYYGTVQVAAVISGGKITDVKFLQYPDTHSTSVFINQQAMPYLTQEAVQAQSANVNIVSGATETSMAFQKSLGSALVQAKA